jgi:hypothetical protein
MMLNRIALMLRISAREDAQGIVLQVSSADLARALPLQQRSFLLTLEHEPDATDSRGYLHSLDDDIRYPIQCNVALFEAAAEYFGRADGRV